MISAQSDPVVQEHLIKKYMLLPNQVFTNRLLRLMHLGF